MRQSDARTAGGSFEVTGILLAGGQSSRMGTDKALLPVQGSASIERAAEALKTVCSRVLLAAREASRYEFLGLEQAADHFPGKGPMAGLHAGLTASQTEWNAAAACDMPLVTGDMIKALVQAAIQAERQEGGAAMQVKPLEAVIPVLDGRPQPLLAVYRRSVQHSLEQCLGRGELRLMFWLRSLNALYVPAETLFADGRGLYNMNNPADYETVLCLSEGKRRT